MSEPAPAEVLRVASCSGFYGDRDSALAEVVRGGPVDVVVGDYLAELTMLVLARGRAKDPTRGWATSFVRQLEDVLGEVVDRGVRVVVDAGGLAPRACADAVGALGARLGVDVRVATVAGDDLVPRLDELADAGTDLAHARDGRPLPGRPLTANAYLGCWGVVEALRTDAHVVVTGRTTDASTLVGAAAHRFGWTREDLDELAGATVLGHLLECGAHVTGGNYAFFTELLADGVDLDHVGFPVAEVRADGSGVVTKHPGTGGAVTLGTVTAQLLYEVDGPRYLGPDVVTRLDTVRLADDGPDRVLVHGVRGEPASGSLKVAVNLLGGYRNTSELLVAGLDVEEKAALAGRQLRAALAGREPERLDVELVRTDAVDAASTEQATARLRVTARDPDRDVVGRRFAAAAVQLALASYPGMNLPGPPGEAVPYGVFWPALVPAEAVPSVVGAPDGTTTEVSSVPAGAAPGDLGEPVAWADVAVDADGPGADETLRVPLGRVLGARSGDKGGDANVGLWARDEAGWAWLRGWLDVDRVRRLAPEVGDLPVELHPLPHLRAVDVVVRGLLGEGVAETTRFDPQAKALGELLRARLVDVPRALVPARWHHEAR